jgi:serine/threonine protein kinase/tetratricopeptide (TPR) repeat protein
MIGRSLGHYKILDQLGAGGMGEVYLAEDKVLKRQVALKVLPARLAGDQQRLERFRREAETLAALDHPNIVTIYSVEKAEEVHFLTMQFIQGKPLSEVIPRHGLPLARYLHLAIPLADAVSNAHERGVVHRDLKPNNIMVTGDERILVLDFGLAKLSHSGSEVVELDATTDKLTGSSQFLGTLPYMSPEQIRGKEVDHRSDIFSLGVVLYLMATGEYPFQSGSKADLASSILRDTPSSVSEIRGDLPEQLAWTINLCLQKDPNRRLQSTHDVRNELQSLEEDVERKASSESQAVPSPRRWWTDWRWVGGIAAVVAITVLWLVFNTQGQVEPVAVVDTRGRVESVAVLPFANLTGDSNQQYLGEGISAGLIQRLSEVQGLSLVSRSETWTPRNLDLSVRELAEKLGVTLVVEGDVQGEAEHLQVNVSVSEPNQGIVLWSQSYEQQPVDLFSLQREIAHQLTGFLTLTLSRSERRRLGKDPASSFTAYRRYLDGTLMLGSSADRAKELFNEALEEEPDFALAHAGLSQALWKIYHRDPSEQTLAEAEEEARQAVALDSELPAAQVALARVQESRWQSVETVEDVRSLLPAHPRPDDAVRELAFDYEQVGQMGEAEICYRAATELGSESWFNWNSWGAFLIRFARYDEARNALDRAIELAPPDVDWPQQNRAALFLLEGAFEESIAAYEQMWQTSRDADMASNLATAYYFSERQNRLEKAEEYYRTAAELDPDSAEIQGNLGDVLLKIGHRDQARAHYRQALTIVEKEIGAIDDFQISNFEQWRPLAVKRAIYTAKSEDCDNALELTAELRADLPETAQNLHDLAYVYALCNDFELAIEALGKAIADGFSPQLIAQEDEFRALHELPEFQQLVR